MNARAFRADLCEEKFAYSARGACRKMRPCPILAGADMVPEREVHVHLLPSLAPTGCLTGGIAVVIDVLRATTTIIHALAAGCTAVRPCAEVHEAKELADSLQAGKVLLGGERAGKPLAGFDV